MSRINVECKEDRREVTGNYVQKYYDVSEAKFREIRLCILVQSFRFKFLNIKLISGKCLTKS